MKQFLSAEEGEDEPTAGGTPKASRRNVGLSTLVVGHEIEHNVLPSILKCLVDASSELIVSIEPCSTTALDERC
jgi:hypothetical protein